jgi:peptidyl-prolyl cis-trans isomerase A (cyclophilin A)
MLLKSIRVMTIMLLTVLVLSAAAMAAGETTIPQKDSKKPRNTASAAVLNSTVPIKTDLPHMKQQANKPNPERNPGMYAEIETSLGLITCKLFDKESPVTVESFTGLAEGTKEWVDPKTGQKVKRPFFDGLIFHRVIPKFMIQGGCPLGTGTGGPGYKYKNEDSPALNFDQKGILAMANAGRDTNGSQFFITVAPCSFLNGGYTIFGKVTGGQDVADKISQVPRNASDRPNENVVIKKITIKRVKMQ